MIRELLFNLTFVGLLFLSALVFGRGLVYGRDSPITVSVYPQVALKNPNQRQTFRFRWRIEPDKGNRRLALMYTCGKELNHSQGEVNGEKHPITTERYVELTVLQDCEFMACVVQVKEGKAQTLCDWGTVLTGEQ